MSKLLIVLAVLIGGSGLIVATTIRTNAESELRTAEIAEKEAFRRVYPADGKPIAPGDFIRQHKILDTAKETKAHKEARKAEANRTAGLLTILSVLWGLGLIGAAAWTSSKNAPEQK